MSSNSSVSVRLLMSSGARMPFYASKEAAGADLCAALPDGPVMLDPHGGMAIIPTGLIMEIPCGFEGQVRPRSGLAARHGVTEHRDALGEVLVKISDNHGVYRGRGVSTDVIEASLQSLLSAVNRMIEVAEGNEQETEESDHSAGRKAKEWVPLSEEARSRDMKVTGTVEGDVTKEQYHGL